jgi:predicted alpha/beta-hydrolase family hydrolase
VTAVAVLEVDTPQGPGRLHVSASGRPAAETSATLLLGHGAGGGVGAPDLELLARRLPPLGVTVVRFEQPWRTAGRRVAVRPAQLDIAWSAAVQHVRGQPWFGGRLACRTADDAVAGVVCLSFPLHLPGQPEKSRLPELLSPTVPRLVLQGSNDAFGGAEELRTALAGARGVTVVSLPGADHGFRLAKSSPFTPADLRASVFAEVASFVLDPDGGADAPARE